MEEIENTEVNTRPKTAPPVLFTPSKYASASHVKTPKSSARNMSALSTPNQGSPTSSTASSAREAARIAKITSTAEKVRKVAELKVKWAEEKERKLQLNSAQRANELKRLQDNSQMAAESRRKNAEVRRATEQEKKTLEQEQLSISLEACTQLALDLEQMRKDRRRKSVLLNADITKKAKEREQRILQEHKEAEVDLLASKRIDAISVQCAKKVDEERRRESLIGRGKIHLKHREITSELAKREAEEDRSLLEFRHEAWKKSQEAKVEKYERDRQSIAGRLDSWRDQRVVQKGLEDKEFDSYTDTMTSRRNDWTDIQSYKQSLARRDRQSLAGRLDKWREEKCIEARRREQVAEAREYEAELQRQAMEDLRAYESTLQSSRRDSLAYRLEKARQDKSFEEGQQIIQASIEAEERRIQDLDRQDVENYRQRMQDAIRQSLEYRNQSEFQERMRLNGERELAKAAEAEDRKLTEQAWRDVRAFQERQRDEQRRSLAARLAEHSRQHHEELIAHRAALDAMHADFELKRLAWQDSEQDKARTRERSRRSIACRLDSWRDQRMAEEMHKAKKEMQAEEEALLREMDREALEEAKRVQAAAELEGLAKGSMVF